MNRRALFFTTAAFGTLALMAACSPATTSTLEADLNTGILDSGLIVTALGTVEADINADDPTLINASQNTEILAGLAALQQANANLAALGANATPSSATTPLQQVLAGFNGFAAVINAVLPPAAVVAPALEPVVVIFQAATLLIETVIEPLVTELAASGAAPVTPMPSMAMPVRFAPPPSMTVDQARSVLRIAAQERSR